MKRWLHLMLSLSCAMMRGAPFCFLPSLSPSARHRNTRREIQAGDLDWDERTIWLAPYRVCSGPAGPGGLQIFLPLLLWRTEHERTTACGNSVAPMASCLSSCFRQKAGSRFPCKKTKQMPTVVQTSETKGYHLGGHIFCS